jgi:hypothetical protein
LHIVHGGLCAAAKSTKQTKTNKAAQEEHGTAAPSTTLADAALSSNKHKGSGIAPPTDFLAGMSALINASRTSTTKGLWQMRAQERAEMTSQLHLQSQTKGTPITAEAERSRAEAHANAVAAAAARAAAAPKTASSSSAASSASSPKGKASKNPFPAVLPIDSFWSVSLPFDTDPGLYEDYVRFDGGVRFERILEDLDAFAGNVAHLHVKQGTQKLAAAYKAAQDAAQVAGSDAMPDVMSPLELPELQIVTASVDGITMNPRRRFPMNQHLVMQGCTTWVGNSSMEQWMEIRVVRDPAAWSRLTLEEKMRTSGADPQADREDVILDAFFLMVARDAATQKAAFVPPLDVASLSPPDLARCHPLLTRSASSTSC